MKPHRYSLIYMIAAIGLLLGGFLCARDVSGSGNEGSLFRSGTAFFVTRAGEMLTSAHVVRGCLRLKVWTTDNGSIPATVESVDEAGDMALLSTRHKVDLAAVPGKERVPRNSAVFTIGFGLTPSSALVPVFTRGTMQGEGYVKGRRLLVLRAVLYEGNSGGPVIDGGGHLVGMVIGRYVNRPELSVAVGLSELTNFVGRRGNMESPSTSRIATADPRAELRRISALVQCIE